MESGISLPLTNQEAQVLIQMIDLAVKSQGLLAAEAGVVLSKRIHEAVEKSGGVKNFTQPIKE